MSSQTPSHQPNEVLGPDDQAEMLTAATDLASRWLGGSVVAASDESFGEKENLLDPGPAIFEPGRYGHRGEIVDGWETRRRREAGHDWALIRLGTPGTVTSVDVDTSFFTGNYPESCSIEACGREGYPSPGELNDRATGWVQIVPRSPLRGDTHNTFTVSDPRRFTHLRLSTFPDGGVARLRVLGRVVPDPRPLDGLTIDLASQEHGGAVVASSDGFYTSACALNRPDHARTMGEGWETRRRRDAGHDFVVFQLAFHGAVQRLIVDTAHFKYNASAEIAAYGCDQEPAPSVESPDWRLLLARTRLQPDTPHVFTVTDDQPVAAIRLDAFPDGGLSRVRVIGRIDPAARRRAGHRWFNALPTDQAIRCLIDTGMPPDVAAEVVDQRPLPKGWLDELGGRSDSGRPSGRVAGYLGVLSTMLEGRPRGDRSGTAP
jgi:allantoicase